MVRRFACPVNVPPLIRLSRWCLLFVGVGYGVLRRNVLQRHEDQRRAQRHKPKPKTVGTGNAKCPLVEAVGKKKDIVGKEKDIVEKKRDIVGKEKDIVRKETMGRWGELTVIPFAGNDSDEITMFDLNLFE